MITHTALGLHNVSSETLIRLTACQVSELRPEWNEVRLRFWAKVRVSDSDTECWLWLASRNPAGYGQFTWAARFGRCRPVQAHRTAYELTHGVELAGEQHVLHSCDTPACVNPSHLSLGDHFDNMRDAAAKGRLPRSRPWLQKVTDEQCGQIEALYASGATLQVLADRFGVTKMTISHIVNGKRRQYRQRPALEKVS